MIKKIQPLITVFRRIVDYAPEPGRLTIYRSVLEPHLRYMSAIWGHSPTTHLQPLKVIQNKSLKAILKLPHRYPTENLYQNYNVTKIEQIIAIETVVYIHTLAKKEKINTNNKLHTYNTRNKEKLHQFQSNTKCYGIDSIINKGTKIYNNLLNEIRDTANHAKFKRKVTKILKHPVNPEEK